MANSDVLSLEQARAHLRFTDDEVDEDLDIDAMRLAAIAAVEDHLGRPLVDPVLGWADAAAVPANVVHAIKLVLGSLYRNRETTITGTTGTELAIGGGPAVRFLLERYVRVSFS